MTSANVTAITVTIILCATVFAIVYYICRSLPTYDWKDQLKKANDTTERWQAKYEKAAADFESYKQHK